MTVDTTTGMTGEITSSTVVATINKDEASVVGMLERSRSWLSNAIDAEDVAAIKAQVRTAETYAKELGLSKEIQLDAAEMVRRAEYALGKAIRRGQAEGTIAKRGDIGGVPPNAQSRGLLHKEFSHSTDFASNTELHGNPTKGAPGILAVADMEPEQFEEAITEAREEGNLSRANVVRKVKQQPGHQTRDQRADLIADLAQQGYSSRQMPAKVGVTEESVRRLARDYGIEIPADRSVSRSRRINSTQVVENTATALEGLVMGVELIDYAAVDPAVASQWADSLTESLKVLNGFARQIRKAAQ